MAEPLRAYLAGKVSLHSFFGSEHWRDDACQQLERQSGRTIVNLDPTRSRDGSSLHHGNARFIFGRDCFLIRAADVVIVYLSDDISVGGSQEMLIAKYYDKPLIGIAAPGGKFRCDKRIDGQTYPDWTHPFVSVPCDRLVDDLAGAAELLKNFEGLLKHVKNMSLIDEAIIYYQANSGEAL